MRICEFSAFILFCTSFFFPQLAGADTFSDQASWEAALCESHTMRAEPYTLNLPDNSAQNPVDNPYATTWGTYTNPNFEFNNGVDIAGDEGMVVSNSGAVLDIIGQTELCNGVGLCYSGGDLTITCTLSDGSVETLTAPATADLVTTEFFGWTNETGQDVVQIQINAQVNETNFVFCTDIAFTGETCPDEPGTAQDTLDHLIDDVAALLPSGNAADDKCVVKAIQRLTGMQNASLWLDGDRLDSKKGHKFFKRARFAIRSLECVSSVDTGAIVSAINDLQLQVLDVEIQYAVENGGNGGSIATALFFRFVGQFQAANGNYQAASNNFGIAWEYANVA